MSVYISRLRTINRIISFLLFFIVLYILYFGIEPELNLIVVKAFDSTNGYIYNGQTAKLRGNLSENVLRDFPKDNRLIIPKIRVNGPINEGNDSEILNRGLWRRPNTSTPDLGGNTVITAHRFLYRRGPNTFYHLNNLSIDDEIIIFWNDKEYLYLVSEIDVVEPDFIEIEEPTTIDILTLYTCTPLYTSKKRLVVRAELVEVYESTSI